MGWALAKPIMGVAVWSGGRWVSLPLNPSYLLHLLQSLQRLQGAAVWSGCRKRFAFAQPILRPRPALRVARQHLAHRFDEAVLRHGELGLRLLAQVVVALLRQARQLGADDQVLDLHLALLLLVRALDDYARAAAAVGVFHLRAEFARAEIELGADAPCPQRRGHAL